jgi:hypothetical protein
MPNPNDPIGWAIAHTPDRMPDEGGCEWPDLFWWLR